MKTMIVILCAAALAGCASWQQAVSGAQASAVVDAKAVDDGVIRAWSVAACATPVSAAIRNPQILQAIRDLCFPAGTASPATLFDAPVPAAIVPVKP